MSALTDDELNLVVEHLRKLRTRHLEFEQSPLTSNMVMNLFVGEQDQPAVRQAALLYPELVSTDITASQVHLGVETKNDVFAADVSIFVRFPDGEPRWKIPPHAGITDYAVENGSEVILREYINRLGEVYLDYHRAEEAVHYLDGVCGAPWQLEFFWPSFSALAQRILKDNPNNKHAMRLVKKLGSKTKHLLPPMPQPMRATLRDCGGLLMVGMMLGEPPPTPPVYAELANVYNIEPLFD